MALAEKSWFHYAMILQTWIAKKSIKDGNLLHSLIIKTGREFAIPIAVSNHLLHLYAKCGKPQDAHKLFQRMPMANQFSWNTLIQGLISRGEINFARKLFDKIPKKNNFTWSILIKGYANSGKLEESQHLFDQMPCRNNFSWMAMLEVHAKYGSPLQACQLFDKMPEQNKYALNMILNSLIRNGLSHEGLDLFMKIDRMIMKDDRYVLTSILNACSKLEGIEQGKQVHGRVIKLAKMWDNFLVSALVDIYVKCGRMKDANMLYSSILNPDASVTTALVSGYARQGNYEEALRVFSLMSEGHVVTWSAFISGLIKFGSVEKALEIFVEMLRKGFKAGTAILVSVMNGCASIRLLELGMQVHAHGLKSCLIEHIKVGSGILDMYAKCGCYDLAMRMLDEMEDKDVISCNSMITAYCNCGKVEKARKLFDTMEDRSLVTWNSMILGYTQCGFAEEALDLYTDMRFAGLKGDDVTLASVVSSCACVVSLVKGRQVHAHVWKVFSPRYLNVGSALVDFYAKCGNICDAGMVFEELGERDAAVWNGMILGYSKHGLGREALGLFEEMVRTGVKPNGITFTSVLHACSHSGMVDEGLRYFNSMHSVYGVFPNSGHYASLIDIYGRAGRLEEAEAIIGTWPFGADVAMWGSILSACRVHGNVRLARKAAERLFEIDPHNAGPYKVLSNIYATYGMRDDARDVGVAMKENNVLKNSEIS